MKGNRNPSRTAAFHPSHGVHSSPRFDQSWSFHHLVRGGESTGGRRPWFHDSTIVLDLRQHTIQLTETSLKGGGHSTSAYLREGHERGQTTTHGKNARVLDAAAPDHCSRCVKLAEHVAASSHEIDTVPVPVSLGPLVTSKIL